MEVSCPDCRKRFLVPEDKLPANTKAAFACPECKGKIVIDTRTEKESKKEEKKEDDVLYSLASAPADGPIEFFEEGTKKGLVCVPASMKDRVVVQLAELDYKTSTAEDLRTFYMKVRYNHYDVVIVNEKIGDDGSQGGQILAYFQRLRMPIRRNIFVVLISDEYQTLHTLGAYSRSADIVVNEADLDNLREIMRKSLTQHEHFYRVFKECLQAEGRI